MAFVTYPIPTGFKLYTIAITGGNLAASALTLSDGTNVDGAHPLPVAGAVTVAGVATASAQATAQASLDALVTAAQGTQTIAGSVSVSALPAVTFAAPQHVIVYSLPSVTIANPTDVSTLATAALQGDGNASLASILTKLGEVLTQLQGTLTTAGTATVSGAVSLSGTLPAYASPPAVTASWATAQPVSLASLPAYASPPTVLLGAGSQAVGSVSVSALPSLPAGSNAIGSFTIGGTLPAYAAPPAVTASWATAQHVIVDTAPTTVATGAAGVALALESGGNLAALLARTLLGQQTQANSRSVTNASDTSIRVIDSAPSGVAWTLTAGKQLTLTAAGTLLVAAGTSRLRSLVILSPYVGATVYYFLYHLATAPTWAGSLTIADGTLLQSGQIGASNAAAVTSDLPGGWYVPNGVTLVVSLVAASNANYSAPGSNIFATFRSGS